MSALRHVQEATWSLDRRYGGVLVAGVELCGQLGHACAMPRDVMGAPAPEGRKGRMVQ